MSSGWIASAPIIVASRTTSSILSPLSTACTSDDSGRRAPAVTGNRSSEPQRRRVADRHLDDGAELGAAAVEHRDLGARAEPQHARQVPRFVAAAA